MRLVNVSSYGLKDSLSEGREAFVNKDTSFVKNAKTRLSEAKHRPLLVTLCNSKPKVCIALKI